MTVQLETRKPRTTKARQQPVFFTTMLSLVGDLLLTSDGTALTGVYMGNHQYGPVQRPDWIEGDCNLLNDARVQFSEYFAGTRQAFDLPHHSRGTDFQQKVWTALESIPYGTTISYRDLANLIHQPTASRAVGMANGRNPLSIIVPCHRVIGSDGTLVGYGGGLERKLALLNLEKAAL